MGKDDDLAAQQAAPAVTVTPDANAQEIIKTGHLEKKGGLSWSKRYFALVKKPETPHKAATLFYFKECPPYSHDFAADPNLRGRLDLTWGTKVDVLPGRAFAFQVSLGKRALKVAAASDEERGEWLAALRVTVSAVVQHATVRFNGENWSLPPKYTLSKKIGSGAYGTVASASDESDEARQLNEGAPVEVAIKKVADVFADAVDAKRILREVRLMRHWNHPCVLGLYDIVEPSYSTHFDDLYIVTPLLTTDLSRIIYSRTVLSDPQVLYLLYQTCCGVHYINSAGVLHRDLKPANLIVDVKSCALKVCDFGLSRPYVQGQDDEEMDQFPDKNSSEAERAKYTEYVVTRWYRAPEVMLGFHRYGPAIDAWSIACIFCEVVLKEPLFPGTDPCGNQTVPDRWRRGNDYLHQLKIILQQIGKPTEGDQWFVDNANAKSFLDRLPKYEAKPLAQRFLPTKAKPQQQPPPPGLERLCTSMLAFDPKKRATMGQCLEDSSFDDYREDDLEARAGYRVDMEDVEEVKLESSHIRSMLYRDIRAFHRNSEPMGDRSPLASGEITPSDPHRLTMQTLTTKLDNSSILRDAREAAEMAA